MMRKSWPATRFRRTLELGGSAPQTPWEKLGDPNTKLSTKRGNLNQGIGKAAPAGGR